MFPFPLWAAEGPHAAAAVAGASPELWVLIFTITSFLVVMVVLGAFGWPQIIQALHAREEMIRKNIESAEEARRQAEAQSARYAKELAEMEGRAQEFLSKAEREASQVRDRLLKDAESAARDLADKNHKQLEEERSQVLRSIRAETATLVVEAAEKMLKRSVDRAVQEDVLKEFNQCVTKR